MLSGNWVIQNEEEVEKIKNKADFRGAFYKATMRARKKTMKKALYYKGNAVLGFREYIEDESELTQKIIVRCIGTVVEIDLLLKDSNNAPLSSEKSVGRKDIDSIFITSVAVYPSPLKMESPDIKIFSVGNVIPYYDLSIGSIVVARSVKMRGKAIKSERSTWWKNLREELRRSVKSIGCNMILEYR